MTAPPPPATLRAFSEPAATGLVSISRQLSGSIGAVSLDICIHRPGHIFRRCGALRPRKYQCKADDIDPTFWVVEDWNAHDPFLGSCFTVSGKPTDGIYQEESLLGVPHCAQVLASLAILHALGALELVRTEPDLLVWEGSNRFERVRPLDPGALYSVYRLALHTQINLAQTSVRLGLTHYRNDPRPEFPKLAFASDLVHDRCLLDLGGTLVHLVFTKELGDLTPVDLAPHRLA